MIVEKKNSKKFEFSSKKIVPAKIKIKFGGQRGCSDGRDKVVICLSREAQAYYR